MRYCGLVIDEDVWDEMECPIPRLYEAEIRALAETQKSRLMESIRRAEERE